ncbi:RICIN domain-containing protein [Streptomyces sp. NPDC059447]|uniref:RICIN domain-containing protein n=1 Tax=Streptomyces sp. NPDC059447 TaxID=3346834 RepID=UPI0036C59FE2
MLRRIAIALGSLGLIATAATGTASADSPAPQLQPTGKAHSKVVTPAEAQSLAAAQGLSSVVPGVYERLENANSGKCLLVQGYANGNKAVQYDCTTFDDEYWLREGTATHFRLRNLNSQKCLVVQGGANGAQAFQYDCANYEDQYWYPKNFGYTAVGIQNWNSAKCLVAQGYGNSPVFQYDCVGLADQRWYVG